ncbi:MAG: hypothetical protein AAFQ79_05235 [Pseudomonadota bacterium]
MENTASSEPCANDYYVTLDEASVCHWRGENEHLFNPPETDEPEPPQPIRVYDDVPPEMLGYAKEETEDAMSLLDNPGGDPRSTWKVISDHLAKAELMSTGALRVDDSGYSWEPTPEHREFLEAFVAAHSNNWPDYPGNLARILLNARCILFQSKHHLLLSAQLATAKRMKREADAHATKKKDKLPEVFRLIDRKIASVTKSTDQLTLDAHVRDLCKIGLADDVPAQAYLAEKIKDATCLNLTQARRLIERIVAEKKQADRPKQKSGGNVVGEDDHKDLVTYARGKLEEEHKTEPSLFRYGTAIGRVQHVPEEGTTSVCILNKDGLRAAVNECASFVRKKDKQFRGVSAPVDVINDLYHEHLPLPYLKQVTNYPQFDADVRLLATNQYHETAYLFMRLPDDLELPPVSGNPTVDEVNGAIRLLVAEWLADFPFDGYTRREILIACGIEEPLAPELIRPVPPSLLSFLAFVLQPLIRPVIGKSPTPALLISKPEAGTGATLLVNTAQMVVHGTTSTRTIPKDEDERRKEVFTALRGGDPFLFLDNVTGSVDSPVLAALLTSVTFTGRILGKSEEASIPNNASVVITGNNPRFTRELQRRLSLCRLDAGTDKPELREPEDGWHHPDIEDWVAQNRGQLLWALCTMVNHWKSEGCPKPKGKPVGSYRPWFEVCGGILEACGLEGFQSNRDQIEKVAGSDDDDPMRELVTQWYEEALKPNGCLDMSGQLVKGDTGLAAFCDDRGIELPVPRHVVDGARVYKPSALGQYLSSQAERVFNVDDGVNVRIESGKKGKHGKPWDLVRL